MKRLNPVGVMQGRLLPMYKGRYQAHPVGVWPTELPIASEMGLDLIEFIYEKSEYAKNPLSQTEGLDLIRDAMAGSKVRVKTICANFFMEEPLSSTNPKKSISTLKHLIKVAGQLGVTGIVIPCMESSDIHARADQDRLIESLKECISEAKSAAVQLAIESDLPPKEFANLMARIGSDHVSINYDTGNSAAMGYSPAEEFAAYGSLISHVHIKDRPRRKPNVFLGTGDASFQEIFGLLAKQNFQGSFIMEAFRGPDPIEDLRKQFEILVRYLDQWFYQ